MAKKTGYHDENCTATEESFARKRKVYEKSPKHVRKKKKYKKKTPEKRTKNSGWKPTDRTICHE